MTAAENTKVLVIGLDAVPSQLLFHDLTNELPNIKNMMKHGMYGVLKSCHPPITVPAWTVMMSSNDPGTLGIYGFRHRKGYSYTDGWIVNSNSIKQRRVWEILEQFGKKSVIIGVPPSFPPYKVNGKMISCFITPSSADQYTYPPEVKDEITKIAEGYKFDVVFRTDDRDTVLQELYDMTEKRFRIITRWLSKKDWDFFMFVEIGTDRLHHAFWKFYDKRHPKYVPNNKYEKVIPQYYRYIDQKIGEILELIDENTIVLVVSDHGTKAMSGAFCINEWLIKEGYLVLNEYPKDIITLEKANVNWNKTTAWGWGGYYARIFLNVKGREQHGTINQEEYETFRSDLMKKLQEIKDPDARKMNTFVYRPEEMYKTAIGDRPDLMVYFDDLNWRSAGTIGHNTMYLSENDTGPDDSVHSMEGSFIIYDPKGKWNGVSNKNTIYDIAPTILDIFKIKKPVDMQGSVITNE
jgi:predicted AlkP superfamily phosphohydrolase/phosphomutase